MSISFDFEDGLPPMNIDVLRSEKPIVYMQIADLEMKELSWGAKGLYAYIKSFKGAFSCDNLYTVSKEDKEAVQGYIKELNAVNFVVIEG